MTPEPANPGEIQHDSGARQRLKCYYCRRDKQRCDPFNRQWPDEKCIRCTKKKRPCGPNLKAENRNRNRNHNRRRRRRPSPDSLQASFSTSQTTNTEAIPQPRRSLSATYARADEAADSQGGDFTGFGKSQPTSLLQVPAATLTETGSSATEEIEDEPSLEDLYKLRLFIEIVLLRDRALLPSNVAQHDLSPTLSVSHNLRRMTESTTSEFSTQCTQLIKYIEDVEREDKSAAEQQYQDLLVCIECDHTKKRSEVMAEPWKRVQHKIIKAKLMDGNYFEACVRKIKVNESLMISPSSRSHRRRAEWCRCVLECSKQLTAVNGNLKVASGSPFPATNPAPPLHLALMLRLELDIFSNLLSTKMDSWGELDLLNRNILHVAAECKNSAAIQCLLNQLGPIPDAVASLLQQRDVVARTPLLVAAHLGNVACFQLLVGAGANLTDLDTESLGALELACRAGNKDVVEYLLRYRGDFPVNGRIGPHAPNPLHNAAKGNFGDICELLLAAGADVDMRDLSTGKTAATLAYERGHHDLAFYLSTRPQPVASRGQLPHGDMFNQLDMDTTDYNNQSF